MRSRTTERFRKAFAELPPDLQRQAREAYRIFKDNPAHPGLRFRQVHPTRSIYSARINLDYRALGVMNDHAIVWFWIVDHDQYERLLSRM